jgi:hypothetical protein
MSKSNTPRRGPAHRQTSRKSVTKTLPPAVDGFLWELSKFIAKAASRSGGGNGAA